MSDKAYLLTIRDRTESDDLYILFSEEEGIMEHGIAWDGPDFVEFVQANWRYCDVKNAGCMDSDEFAHRLLARAVDDHE